MQNDNQTSVNNGDAKSRASKWRQRIAVLFISFICASIPVVAYAATADTSVLTSIVEGENQTIEAFASLFGDIAAVSTLSLFAALFGTGAFLIITGNRSFFKKVNLVRLSSKIKAKKR